MPLRLFSLPLLAALLGLVLVGCGTSQGPVESPVIVPKTTKVLDDATRQSLQSYDPTTGELRFGPAATFGALQPDDVLVTQPLPPLAPYGFLRKVVSVQTVGSDTVVETVPAKLTEAIHQGAFKIDQPLKPSMLASSSLVMQGVTLQSDASSRLFTFGLANVVLYDADGNHSTTNDQVRASGSFTLDPTLHVSAGLHFHFCCDVQSRFHFAIGADQSVHVSVTAAAGVNVSKQVDLGSMSFTPITVWVGPVPVVFVPKLAIVASFDGNVSAKLTFSATESLHLVAGTDKPYGQGFHDVSTAQLTGSSNADNLIYQFPGITFDMKPKIGAEFRILVYDLVGPQAGLDAYLEIKGQMPGDPVWKAYAGLEGTLGLHVSVLNYNWNKTIFNESVQIGQETGNTAPLLDASDVSPADGSQVQLDVPVQFNVRGRDAEDGAIYGGTWVSDVDGPLALDSGGQHTFSTAGLRHITVTVTDSAGASASATISLTVLDSPPVATMSNPQPATPAFAGSTELVLQGSAVDANEPGGKLDCTRLHWSSSDVNDVLPADGCPDTQLNPVLQAMTFSSATGSHVITLTATDPQGKSDSKSTTLSVQAPPANYPPVGTITDPTEGESFADYGSVTLTATLTDPDDDTLSYSWDISDASGVVWVSPTGTISGASTQTNGVTTGVPISTVAPSLGCSGEGVPYTVELSVNDSHTWTASTKGITCNYIPR